MKKYFAVILLLAGCSSAPLREINASNSEVIDFASGEEIRLMLDAQLSTGYRWSCVKTPEFVEVLGESEIITEGKGRDGAFDVQVIRLKAVKSGEGEIVLHYSQPWSKKKKVEKTKVLKIISR